MPRARSGRSSACSTTASRSTTSRDAEVELTIQGATVTGCAASSISQISRDPLELVRQAMSEHQYPDGFALFLGTLFAPAEDRDKPGAGSHTRPATWSDLGAKLGTLDNRVTTSRAAPPWIRHARADAQLAV